MRFLADMGVSPQVVAWLRAHGHDAYHVSEKGLFRLPNGHIFRMAAEEERIVLTFDLDFGEILALSGGRTSVVVFRLRRRRTPQVIRRLEMVLKQAGQALEGGAIVTVQDARLRVRVLPIGTG